MLKSVTTQPGAIIPSTVRSTSSQTRPGDLSTKANPEAEGDKWNNGRVDTKE